MMSGSPTKPPGRAALRLVVPGRDGLGRVDRQVVLRGRDQLVVDRLALVVEGVPDRERHAEEPLPADQPVAVEALDPVGVAVLHVGRRPGDLVAALDQRARAGPRHGRRCGCTTAASRRSRAACRPSRRSSSSAASASARRRGRRDSRSRPTIASRAREGGLAGELGVRRRGASPASHSGVSRCSRPSRWITVRTGSCSSRHHCTSVRSPNVQHIAMPAPLSGSAGVGDAPGSRRRRPAMVTVVPNSGW